MDSGVKTLQHILLCTRGQKDHLDLKVWLVPGHFDGIGFGDNIGRSDLNISGPASDFEE